MSTLKLMLLTIALPLQGEKITETVRFRWLLSHSPCWCSAAETDSSPTTVSTPSRKSSGEEHISLSCDGCAQNEGVSDSNCHRTLQQTGYGQKSMCPTSLSSIFNCSRGQAKILGTKLSFYMPVQIWWNTKIWLLYVTNMEIILLWLSI